MPWPRTAAPMAGMLGDLLGGGAESEQVAGLRIGEALDAHAVDCQQHAACGLIDDGQGEAAARAARGRPAPMRAVGCVQRGGGVGLGGSDGLGARRACPARRRTRSQPVHGGLRRPSQRPARGSIDDGAGAVARRPGSAASAGAAPGVDRSPANAVRNPELSSRTLLACTATSDCTGFAAPDFEPVGCSARRLRYPCASCGRLRAWQDTCRSKWSRKLSFGCGAG